MTEVEKIIDRVGPKELSKALGTTTQFIYKVRRQGYFPPARADDVERLYGVPRETLVKDSLRRFITGDSTDDLI